MDHDALTSSDPASPPDPQPDRPGKTVLHNIAALLHAVTGLLGYGRHLLDTIQLRAAASTFTTIAASFGTSNLATILAHLNRGILRAAALERVLLARAATGRDIDIVSRRTSAEETQLAPDDAPASPQADPQAEPSAIRKPKTRKSLPPGRNDPELFMPTPEELERQVRRRSLGRTIAEICLDLGVVPGFCTAEFWNQLFEIMHYCGGGVVTVMREKTRREHAFIQEQDRKPGSNWDWLHLKRDAIRQVLGFFIGEPPCMPAAALATGPP